MGWPRVSQRNTHLLPVVDRRSFCNPPWLSLPPSWLGSRRDLKVVRLSLQPSERLSLIESTSRLATPMATPPLTKMIDTGLLPAPLPTPATRKGHKDSSISLASKRQETGERGRGTEAPARGNRDAWRRELCRKVRAFVLLIYY